MSAAQRIEQIRSRLTDLEVAVLVALLGAISSNDMKNTGFFDILRWWALSNYSCAGMFEFTERYKIKAGQSEFARAFFDEALATGNLSYSFGSHIKLVKDNGCLVMLSSASGAEFAGKRLVCTVPLNIIHEIKFDPPLQHNKMAASKEGHINFGTKFHLEAEGRDLRSWAAVGSIESRICAIRGDGFTPADNTHVVCFAQSAQLQPYEDGQDFLAAIDMVHEMRVKKLVSFLDHCFIVLKLVAICSFADIRSLTLGMARLGSRPSLTRHMVHVSTPL